MFWRRCTRPSTIPTISHNRRDFYCRLAPRAGGVGSASLGIHAFLTISLAVF